MQAVTTQQAKGPAIGSFPMAWRPCKRARSTGSPLTPAAWWKRRSSAKRPRWCWRTTTRTATCSPSEQDKVITRAIVLAAETIGLRVVDHLVASAEEAFSFRQAGLL